MKRLRIVFLTGGILLGGLGSCFQTARDGFDCQLRNGTLICDGGFNLEIPVLGDD